MDPIGRLRQYRLQKKSNDPAEINIVPVTIELATEFNELPRWKGERALSASRMAYLIESIPSISLPFLWYFVRVGGRSKAVYRMNGQNTSRLFVEKPEMIREGMKAIVCGYHCVDEIEVSMLYSTIDARISSRSVSEVNNSFRGGHPRLQPHTKMFVNLCAAGIRMSTRGVSDHGLLSVVERGEIMLENLDFIDDLSKIVNSKNEKTQHLWRAPVIFAMHKTYHVDKKAFYTFWKAVRDGDHVRGTIPDLFREYLLSTGLGGTTIRRSRVDSRNLMSEKCIRAWNAWREGKSYKSFNRIQVLGHIPEAI